ncbi:hypothetical protein QVD17_16280 [Tagetes erecta]|uniref:Uncharacterized protein n=1 Tax=Tagetes erecta TaxID=13708 RepID=A0AAD8P0D4_TARER|nr:hypothetical protein QVD17_16280 [Tagetes erecta]
MKVVVVAVVMVVVARDEGDNGGGSDGGGGGGGGGGGDEDGEDDDNIRALNMEMNKAVNRNLLKGISTPHNGYVLSNFLFADDVIFLGAWEESNFINLLGIVRCFYLVSRLKVSYKKNKIYHSTA